MVLYIINYYYLLLSIVVCDKTKINFYLNIYHPYRCYIMMNTAITTTTNTLVNTEENEDTNNMNFVMNHKYFITGLVSITDMLSDKSEELVETDVNNRTRYEKLQTCCSKIVRQYRHNENILDEGKVLLQKDKDLFTVRDENNKIVTIIPGLDIGLVYDHLNEEEQMYFWQFMYLTFVSSYKMVTSANDKVKANVNEQFMENVRTIEMELQKTGLTINGNIFNPFVGLNDNDNNLEFGVDELYTGIDAPQANTNTVEFILKQMGITDMIDMDKINDQLQNITDDDIVELKKNMSNILGNDPTVTNTCNIMVDKIVENIKEHGVSDMMGLVENMSKDISNTMDKDDLIKTSESMTSFMNSNKNKMEDMINEHGGEDDGFGKQINQMMSMFENLQNNGN